MRPIVVAGGVVIFGAALEGALAGGGVRARLAELRMPALAPPLGVWIAIGGLYYVSCFAVAYRLASARPIDARHGVAFASLVAVVITNALWNYAFFRRRALRLTWRIAVAYAALAAMLSVALLVADGVAALLFVPYLLYLFYGVWWTRAVCELNAPEHPEDRA